jgi:hypothetical protein
MCSHLGERHLGNEAEIPRAGRGLVGDQTGNVIGGVQVDLLLAKAQCRASFAKCNDLHPQYPSVELTSTRDIGDGQDKVVEVIDIHILGPSRR